MLLISLGSVFRRWPIVTKRIWVGWSCVRKGEMCKLSAQGGGATLMDAKFRSTASCSHCRHTFFFVLSLLPREEIFLNNAFVVKLIRIRMHMQYEVLESHLPHIRSSFNCLQRAWAWRELPLSFS
ncbi:unnamed protein product [Ixodes pacificus]